MWALLRGGLGQIDLSWASDEGRKKSKLSEFSLGKLCKMNIMSLAIGAMPQAALA